MAPMSDRADELAQQLIESCDHAPLPDFGEAQVACESCVASVLRAYAEEVRREEREACARTLEAFPPTGHSPAFVNGYAFACRDGATAIRVRGEK